MKLRNCPFCGYRVRIIAPMSSVRCENCGAMVNFKGISDPREIERRWNGDFPRDKSRKNRRNENRKLEMCTETRDFESNGKSGI